MTETILGKTGLSARQIAYTIAIGYIEHVILKDTDALDLAPYKLSVEEERKVIAELHRLRFKLLDHGRLEYCKLRGVDTPVDVEGDL